MERLLILIPLLPFVGFLLNGLLGKKLPRPLVSLIACALPAGAAVLAGLAFREVLSSQDAVLTQNVGDWIRVGDLQVPFALRVDRLAAVMLLVVTGVGTLIHVYATGYMKEDPGYPRFFAYLNLFMAAMLVLVLADNIVLLFLGWEGVGLCSYLLIGFWYKEVANAQAGMKAFVVNRIGDFGFILGIFLIFMTFGAFDFATINAQAASKVASSQAALWWIGLLLFVGATGKSAQIPLYVWLPDAMAGPTPVSALIHAATMVTSGVYLIARLSGLFVVTGVLPIVATIGALTALLAALIALTQTDIKKVLAYSTVSQLGFMFLGVGVGAFGVAVFHLVTHACFKALLFLGAGAVIHSLHHEQDMRKMGGLAKKLPVTTIVYLCGALALAGFPLTSGFFSKDDILHEAHHQHFTLLWIIGLVTALLTAFYTFRQFAMVFLGEYRGGHADAGGHGHSHGAEPGHTTDPQDSPWVMLAPLVVLALLALSAGFLDVPGFVTGVPAQGAAEKMTGWIVGGAIAVAGVLGALWMFIWSPAWRDKLVLGTAPGRLLTRLSYNKFYVDEIYDFFIVKPFAAASLILHYVIDRALIDWICVGGAGFFVRLGGYALRQLQPGRIPAYALLFVVGVLGILSLVIWAAR